MTLADLYSTLIVSDEARGLIPEKPSASQIIASPLPAVSGVPVLPIIQLTTTAGTAAGAQALNTHTADALRELLKDRQAKADISPGPERSDPDGQCPIGGDPTGRPSHAGSILALLLCLIGTVALTHLLEMLRTRREGDTLESVDLDWVLDEDVDEAPDADEEAAGRGAIVLPAFRSRPDR